MSGAPVLLDLGANAYAHQHEVDQVKEELGITHNYFDCWIYGFLENKNFNVKEAVAKLHRREEFEKNELCTAEITDWMMENMRKGIIQVVGSDKDGRVTLYINTCRDKPSSSRRGESRKNFDMFVSYATRLRPESKRCQLAMLINQDHASMWSNLDMTFQADIALRIAKYYPGCVDKMYICKMGRTLAALAKPVFSRLPSIVSERIIIISESDIKNGKLLELYDENVLPIALGGKNDCDKQENYDNFAETIREYYGRLQKAVLSGKSVKEWELENLLAAGYGANRSTPYEPLRYSVIERRLSPSVSLRSRVREPTVRDDDSWSSRSARAGADADFPQDMLSCDSVSEGMLRSQTQHYASHAAGRAALDEVVLGLGTTRTGDLFVDYVNQFVSIETFFRINVVEMYEREWLQMVQNEVKERQLIALRSETIGGDSLFKGFPVTVQVVVRGFLWLCMVVMAAFFFIGTLFIALLGTMTLLNIFFAMFAEPYNVFPYGCAFAVVAFQFVMFCSRGFDFARNTFNGKLIQILRPFGNRALLFQVILSVCGTIGYFIVFCVLADRYDPLTGLEFSIAIGWIVAVCLIFLYHVVYAFGIKTFTKPSYAHGSRVNNAETTLYLLLDVEIDDDVVRNRSSTEVIVFCVLAVVAIAFGVAYITGGGFFFLCGTIVATALLLVMAVVLFALNNASSSSSVATVGVFYACLFWMDVVFTMSAHAWDRRWGGSMLTVLFLMLVFCMSLFVSIFGPWRGPARRWLFRTSWLLVLAHLIGCVIVLLVFNYRMGLFVLALAVHLLIAVFRTNDATNHYGVLTVSLAFVLSLLACCLLGHTDASAVYHHSVSGSLLPTYAVSHQSGAQAGQPEADVFTSSFFPPVCLARFPDAPLDITGMALFAKLGYNADDDAQLEDLNRWFPDFERETVDLSNLTDDVVDMNAGMFRYNGTYADTDEAYSTLVVTVRPGTNVQSNIEAMTIWIHMYAVSFFSFLMPPQYLAPILPYLSFVQDMTPLRWKARLDRLTRLVNEGVSRFCGPNDYVYLVGHGPTGAALSYIGLQSDARVKIVTFSSPETVPSVIGAGATMELISHSVLSVLPATSTMNSWFMRSGQTQIVPCYAGGDSCDDLDVMISHLAALCGYNGTMS